MIPRILQLAQLLISIFLLLIAVVHATNDDQILHNSHTTNDHLRRATTTDSVQNYLLSPTLPLGDINVVVLTDVHSWVAGHSRHEPLYNANYGHVLSFYEILQSYFEDLPQQKQQDLFFVMNGDFVDGTGLSTYPPEHLVPILQRMPWDALTIGNHELYKNSTIDYITQPDGFVDSWEGRYVTSNVLLTKTQHPLGNRYTFLRGKYSTILTFGFLYNFQDNDPITTIELVEEVVQADWFLQVLNSQRSNDGDDIGDTATSSSNDFAYDAILILAHMDVEHPLAYVILQAIRSVCGDTMPIQFITGHTHYRGKANLDPTSTSVEAGRYLDTVGFVSFPRIDTVLATGGGDDSNISSLFQHQFLDANVETLELALTGGTSSSNSRKQSLLPQGLTTPNGTALSALIQQTEEEMGLFEIIGCVPRTYHFEEGMDQLDSLWGLYMKQVIANDPNFNKHEEEYLYVQGTGGFRYDLFAGNVTLTDFISVTPFNDTIFLVARDLEGSILKKAFAKLLEPNEYLKKLPKYALSKDIDSTKKYTVVTADFDVQYISETLTITTGQSYEPIQQYYDARRKNGQRAITTSSIWMDYLSASLNSCKVDDESSATSAEKAIISVVALLGGIICVALFTFFHLQSRTTRSEKEYDVGTVAKQGKLVEEHDPDSTTDIL